MKKGYLYFPVLLSDGSTAVMFGPSRTSLEFWFMTEGVSFSERRTPQGAIVEDGKKSITTCSIARVTRGRKSYKEAQMDSRQMKVR